MRVRQMRGMLRLVFRVIGRREGEERKSVGLFELVV